MAVYVKGWEHNSVDSKFARNYIVEALDKGDDQAFPTARCAADANGLAKMNGGINVTNCRNIESGWIGEGNIIEFDDGFIDADHQILYPLDMLIGG